MLFGYSEDLIISTNFEPPVNEWMNESKKYRYWKSQFKECCTVVDIYKVKIYTNMNTLGEKALTIFSGIKIFVRKVTTRKVTPK